MSRRTLIARLDNAGDVLLTGPSVRAVAAVNDVVLLCSPQGRPAAELLPGVSRIVTAHAGWIDAHPQPITDTAIRAFVHELRRLRVDDAAILVSSHQSPLPLALLLRQAGVSKIAAVSHDYAGSLLDARIPGDPDLHEVVRNLTVVDALGYRLPDDDDGRLAVRSSCAPTGVSTWSGAVVIHPGASVPARTWSADRWQALAGALAKRGHEVVVTGGPSERDLTAFVAKAHRRVVDLGARCTFRELAAVLGSARVVCCGDTGPMHLAAAVHTPIVALFPPTVPAARWRPWLTPHELLGWQDIDCAGCRSRACPLEAHPCLAAVRVDDAVSAVERLLDGSPVRTLPVRSGAGGRHLHSVGALG